MKVVYGDNVVNDHESYAKLSLGSTEHDLKTHRGGVRATLSRLRTKFWLVKGRQMVKKILSRCVVCKKLEGRPCSVTKVADLPEFQIREVPPFSKVGIDFAGPLFAKCCSKSSRKVYIALFTCCVTRALHLELVRDLPAETFLCCLRKFAARSGMPDLMVSDNAKTFKASEIRSPKEPKVKAELQTKWVTWRFNLERAPWWGGFFERMVRSVKRCLRKVLGNAKLTVEELSTVLVEVEGTLNARPLTEEYEDFEGEVLTPSHFIYSRAINFIPDRQGAKQEGTCEQRYRYISLVLQHYWKRWQAEYLTGLRKFHKCKIGYVRKVLVKGDVYGEGEKRVNWKVAMVERLIVGRDKNIRGAKVKVAGKGKPVYLKRPMRKLYPQEVQVQPGGNEEERDTHVANSEGAFHERARRAAAVIRELKICNAAARRRAFKTKNIFIEDNTHE